MVLLSWSFRTQISTASVASSRGNQPLAGRASTSYSVSSSSDSISSEIAPHPHRQSGQLPGSVTESPGQPMPHGFRIHSLTTGGDDGTRGIVNLSFVSDEEDFVSAEKSQEGNGMPSRINSGHNSGREMQEAEENDRAWLEMKLRAPENQNCTLSPHELDQFLKFRQQTNDEPWMPHVRGYFIVERLRTLIRAFSERAQRFKARIKRPVTPSPSPPPLDLDDEDVRNRLRLDSLIMYKADTPVEDAWREEHVELKCCSPKRRYLPLLPPVLDPQGKVYILWLFIVIMCFLYNAWAIFIRAIFPYQTPDNLPIFLFFDYFSDFIYILDIVCFKVRVKFLHNGLWAEDQKIIRKNYFQQSMFKFDLLSLLPLDLLYLKYGIKPLLRLPRVLKIQTFWEFFNRVDAVAKAPYVIRVLRSLIYMMYLIHLNACAYYAMSVWEGIGSNSWVFQGIGNAYIRCFYFATKTATSIGKNPKPQNEYEYLFMTFSWLMGVFVFAFLIGQIRDIVATATQNKTKYRELTDHTIRYMRNLNLPEDLQKRVRLWLTHTWEQQKVFNESQVLATLPQKMQTDLALSVHYNTISKVELFKDCERALLRDLVLKLKPVLFLPGDYICYKGEVGQEMYIVNTGHVQVVSDDGETVLATLTEGSVFGELCVLGLPESRRRLCDVRSKGFSSLFVLTKSDLWDTLKNYPDGQDTLWRKVRGMTQESNSRSSSSSRLINSEEDDADSLVIIKDRRPSTPKLVKTVMQVIPADFKCAQIMRRRSSVASAVTFVSNPGSSDAPKKDSLPQIDVSSHSILKNPCISPRQSINQGMLITGDANNNKQDQTHNPISLASSSEEKESTPNHRKEETSNNDSIQINTALNIDSDLINDILQKLPVTAEEPISNGENIHNNLIQVPNENNLNPGSPPNPMKPESMATTIQETGSNQSFGMKNGNAENKPNTWKYDDSNDEGTEEKDDQWNDLFNLSTLGLHSLFQAAIPEADEYLDWTQQIEDDNLHVKITRSISQTFASPSSHTSLRQAKAGYDNLGFLANDKLSRSHSSLNKDTSSC